MSRLRERYASDTIAMKSTLDQHRNALAEQQTENIILRDILASRGILFQAEFENRKAAMMMQQPRNGSFAPSSTDSRSGSYGQLSPTVLSSSSRSPPSATRQKYSNVGLSGNTGVSNSGSFHGHSPAEPGISERVIKAEQTAVSDMPGIFERNQQLGIDFILA